MTFSKTLFRFLFAATLVLLPAGAGAHDYRIGSLRIDHPWATATPKGAKVGAGYITIINDGSQADRLIAITSPAARKVTIHASIREGDVVKMRALDKGLTFEKAGSIEVEYDVEPLGTKAPKPAAHTHGH